MEMKFLNWQITSIRILVFFALIIFTKDLMANSVRKVNRHGLDISFLLEAPYLKQKLGCDLDSVMSAEDMYFIRDAINPIILFVMRVSDDLPSGKAAPLVRTAGGHDRLRRPPKDDRDSMPQRYGHLREFDWEVRGPTEIAVTVDFGMIRGHPLYTDRFVFIKEDGTWKFDRHGWGAPISNLPLK